MAKVIKNYNKLVRDKIPAIIQAKGEHCEFYRLDATQQPAEYQIALLDKLEEELEEFRASGDPMELVDLVEAALALADAAGLPDYRFEGARLAKRRERGGFDDAVILVSAEEEE